MTVFIYFQLFMTCLRRHRRSRSASRSPRRRLSRSPSPRRWVLKHFSHTLNLVMFRTTTTSTLFFMFTVTKKRRRRTRSVRRSGTETGGRTGTAAEMKENAPQVRRRRAKTRNEIGNASPTVRKETLRYVQSTDFSTDITSIQLNIPVGGHFLYES